MGLRNPFRFAVNRNNGDVYLGDYSPDAGAAEPAARAGRPRPLDAHQASRRTTAGRTASTPDMPYVDYDFATKTSGRGVQLQRADERLAAQHRPAAAAAGRAAGRLVLLRRRRRCSRSSGRGHAGRHRARWAARPTTPTPATARAFRFPNYYNGRAAVLRVDARLHQGVPPQRPRRLARDPARSPRVVDNPMDMEFGPDGALYVLEYGDGYFAENPDAQLARINFVRGNHTPVAEGRGRRRPPGRAPLTVTFSSAGTTDPDGDPLAYAWDFDADGTVDSHRRRTRRSRTRQNGTYRATLKVTDRTGRSASADVAGARRQPAAGGRADHDADGRAGRSSSATRSPTRSRSPTTRRSTARRSPWPTSSATRRTATRSPRPRAAPGTITTFLDGGPRRRGEPQRRVRRLLHRPR